jgi:hypothetical protein
LYLYVSVLELSTERDLGILYYARPCTYLRYKLKGRAPETADEESLKMAVLRRLAADLMAQRSGDIPESSEEQPIFIRHTS